MTEIPEHLLKRSRERRAALGLPTEGGEPAAASRPRAAGEPARRGRSAPARRPRRPGRRPPRPCARRPRAGGAAAKPVPAYVQAAKRRRKIPIWAMPVLALLPLWAFMYALAMRPQTKELVGPARRGRRGLRRSARRATAPAARAASATRS